MNKDNSILLKSIPVDLEKEENFEQLIHELKLLKNKGYRKTEVLVYKDVVEEVKQQGIDEEIFNRIKEKQDLPAYVILDFMNCAGIIEEDDFQIRATDVQRFS
ncbi:hypothetical protein LJE86_17665 [bacterium BMS3Abin03]|jgi:hypothetical protein|nr:hypothetical protein [bacterium BMS3Abin03]MCG6960194.1 hypothetical protein [bacterium BMS3Abin03]